MTQPCNHDYRENPVVETSRFLLNIPTLGAFDDFVPRKCRRCGAEEPS